MFISTEHAQLVEERVLEIHLGIHLAGALPREHEAGQGHTGGSQLGQIHLLQRDLREDLDPLSKGVGDLDAPRGAGGLPEQVDHVAEHGVHAGAVDAPVDAGQHVGLCPAKLVGIQRGQLADLQNRGGLGLVELGRNEQGAGGPQGDLVLRYSPREHEAVQDVGGRRDGVLVPVVSLSDIHKPLDEVAPPVGVQAPATQEARRIGRRHEVGLDAEVLEEAVLGRDGSRGKQTV
mmetsp:Transcript_1232/g.5222  ORF Transcript_1232/g.5222 Transcript_1232/m.5222 type:complete len:233 (+) Transcript_1232:374-1072(+)